MFKFFQNKYLLFSRAGTNNEDILRDKQIIFANHTYLISIGIIFVYIIFYSIYDFNLFLPIIIFDVFVIITIIFALFLNVNHQFLSSKIFFLFVASIFLVFLSFHYGAESGFHFFYFIIMSFIIITFNFDVKIEKWLGPLWLIVSFCLFLLSETYLREIEPLFSLPKDLLRPLYLISLMSSFSFFILLLAALMRSLKKRIIKE